MQNNDYREAIEKYSQMIYRLAFSGTGNVCDAEDITQNVFYKLLKYRKQFTDEEHRKAWLLRVAVNEIKLFKRSAWFRKRDDNSDISEIQSDNDICTHTENKLIYDAVMQLDHDQRITVILFYFYDYPCSKIAEMSRTNESTVRSRLKRAREKLKIILKEDML